MKKWLKILICALAGVLALGSVSATFAAGITIMAQPEIRNYAPGDYMYLEVFAEKTVSYKIGGYKVEISYDTSMVEFISGTIMGDSYGIVADETSTNGDLDKGFLVVNDKKGVDGTSSGTVSLVYMNANFNPLRIYNDNLAMVKFQVKNSASVGSVASFAITDYEVYDESSNKLDASDIAVGDAKQINIKAASQFNVVGDIDGDGLLTVKDVTRLLRWVALYIKLTDTQILRGDINNDGYTNLKDATAMLIRIAAG